MSLLANRQPKAKSRPIHGVAKWLSPMGFLGQGTLAINGTPYGVETLRDGGHVTGYRMVKPDGTTYDLCTSEERWTCDCPDATFHPERPGGCKHQAALQAALAVAGKQ
jgi:hypothetical protein